MFVFLLKRKQKLNTGKSVRGGKKNSATLIVKIKNILKICFYLFIHVFFFIAGHQMYIFG
jgi:hypothetical protein